jgi:hypothetical protein
MNSGIDFAVLKHWQKGLRDEIGAGRKESLRKQLYLRNAVNRFHPGGALLSLLGPSNFYFVLSGGKAT